MSKTQAGANNNVAIWRWVVGILIAACGALAMGGAGYLKGEVSDVAQLMDGHVQRDGHPVIVERVDRMQRDIEEIKTDQRAIQVGVNELLRRVPPQ